MAAISVWCSLFWVPRHIGCHVIFEAESIPGWLVAWLTKQPERSLLCIPKTCATEVGDS